MDLINIDNNDLLNIIFLDINRFSKLQNKSTFFKNNHAKVKLSIFSSALSIARS